MDLTGIATKLKYHTVVVKEAATPEQIMAKYYKKREHLSPRQVQMLQYHTSIEQPSIIETFEKSLGISK